MKMRLLAALLPLLVLGLTPLLASAHAEPESSTPPIGGTVNTVPTEVEVVFTQEVVRQGEDSSITVIDAAGADVTVGASEVDDANRLIIRVDLQPNLPDGAYTVQWRTVSAADGDSSSGSFLFTVAAGPSATPTADATDPPTPEETEEETPEVTQTPTAVVDSAQDEDDDDDGIPTWLIVLAVVGVIAVAGVGAGAYMFVRSG